MSWDKLTTFLLRDKTPAPREPGEIVRVKNNALSYSRRFRGQWFAPEYDFSEISRAQDTDSYVFRAVKKKVDRFITAGYEFVGKNQEAVDYITYRIKHMELASNRPFLLQIEETAHDLSRYSNCMWVKVRSPMLSPGKRRFVYENPQSEPKALEPVAAYFILPFETLDLKQKLNGELKKVRQTVPGGDDREFSPEDVIHFYAMRKPGFSVATPELHPAIDDVALLRRLEENVEELVETSLFPVFHYKIGTDERPEVVGPTGEAESEIVQRKIKYMPAGSIYVSDHRHQIVPLGAEGHALRIDFYLEYFKKRVFAAIGTTSVDMGEGTGATRSTASQMSKSMMLDIESIQTRIKMFIDHFVINELLLEGGFNPLDKGTKVEIRFGAIDKDDRRADENQAIQLWHANGITETEFRARIGRQGFTDEERNQTYYKLYEEPKQLISLMGPGNAAAETAAQIPNSAVTPEAVNKEKQFASKREADRRKAAKTNASSGSAAASAAKSRPSNQYGTRSGPKTTSDRLVVFETEGVELLLDFALTDAELLEWQAEVRNRFNAIRHTGVSFETVATNMLKRLRDAR